MVKLAWLLALLEFVACIAVADAAGIRNQGVHFAHDASSATLRGHVTGRETVQYHLGVRAGQMLQVALNSRSTAICINVFEPGRESGRDAAAYIGETGGNRAALRTARDGDYLIQVFLVRAAARRNENAAHELDVSVRNGAEALPSRPHDALVPGTNFHATGTLPCARSADQPMRGCRFGVTRGAAQGDGTVTITWPDGGSRVIVFEKNTAVRYDESQADGDARMTVRRQGDLFQIAIGT